MDHDSNEENPVLDRPALTEKILRADVFRPVPDNAVDLPVICNSVDSADTILAFETSRSADGTPITSGSHTPRERPKDASSGFADGDDCALKLATHPDEKNPSEYATSRSSPSVQRVAEGMARMSCTSMSASGSTGVETPRWAKNSPKRSTGYSNTYADQLSIPLLRCADYMDSFRAESPSSAHVRAHTARSAVSYFSIHTPVAAQQDERYIFPTPECASPSNHRDVLISSCTSVRTNDDEESGRSHARFKRGLEQRVHILEKQLKERTRTAQKYAECMGRLSQENREIEEQISTKLAAQSDFLQDYGLFLVCSEEFPRAASLADFKLAVSKRVGVSWCRRLEMQADHFYRGHSLEEYPIYALSNALVNRCYQHVRGAVSTAAAAPFHLAMWPFKAGMMSLQMVKQIWN